MNNEQVLIHLKIILAIKMTTFCREQLWFAGKHRLVVKNQPEHQIVQPSSGGEKIKQIFCNKNNNNSKISNSSKNNNNNR